MEALQLEENGQELQEKTYVQEVSLRDRVKTILAELHMNKLELAMRLDISRTYMSQYLNGKYKSDPATIENKLREFVEEYEKGKPGETADAADEAAGEKASGALRPKTDYFESRDYMQTIGICRSCQENTALGIIVAKSGYGKTHALKKYAKLPRVIYIEGNETMNCKDMVRRIERRIGMSRSYGSIDERTERITEFFSVNKGYLIIMDEADKLINKYTQKKIELLRTITDSSDVGLVIAGEPVLETLLKAYDSRFANRIDFYYKLRGLSGQEVRDYLEGYEMDENVMEEFISRAKNSQTGCFRLLDRTLNNVLRILRDTGNTKITMKVMSQASNMMLL